MNNDLIDNEQACTPEEIDEAAVWIARLRAPDRTITVERGLQRWLAAKASHGAAFEIVSNAWELTGAMQRRPFPRVSRWERSGFRVGFATAALACTALIIFIGASVQIITQGVSSDVGEQRTLTLEDGTRVFLNTASRLVVDYDESERQVELKSGEALFEVAKRADWPFVVVAGGRKITALGTSFVVRNDDRDLSVTLIEGKVAVTPRAPLVQLPLSRPQVEPVTLAPGQRLTLADDQPSRIDHPSIEQLTAWRRGVVEFDETELRSAAEEMNRYSKLKVVLGTPGIGDIRINGVFRAGDAVGFAAALSRAYDLKLERSADELVLSGAAKLTTAAHRSSS